jgi:NADH-quinone oxidoreductase subunit N
MPPFVGPEVAWFALSPLLVLAAGGLLLLVVGALTPQWPRGLYAAVTASVAGTAGVLAALQWSRIADDGPTTLVAGAMSYDAFAQFLTITIAVAVILVVMITDEDLRNSDADGPEVYGLFLMAATGGVIMAAANDLIVLFLGLEALSLALYVLAASARKRADSQESGLKYFVLGGFSSAFFLYGIALIYGGTGSTNIGGIISSLQSSVTTGGDNALVLAGIALLLVGLGFKVAAVPFHVWAPDVYQGAPTPVTAFMASVGKAAAFAAIVRVLIVALPFYREDWRPAIWMLAVLSLVVGSALAVVQTNVKRMLAYSSISHAGFLLVAIEAAGHRAGEPNPGTGVAALVIYLLAYSVLVIGTFGVVTVVGRNTSGDVTLDAFKGLSTRRPALALAFTVFLFAQAGVPFTSGFVAKFGVIQAAVEERSYAIAIIAMVAAVIAAFLYLRIMVSVWLSGSSETSSENSAEATDGSPDRTLQIPVAAGLAIGAAAVFTVAVGILPGWLISTAEAVTIFAR